MYNVITLHIHVTVMHSRIIYIYIMGMRTTTLLRWLLSRHGPPDQSDPPPIPAEVPLTVARAPFASCFRMMTYSPCVPTTFLKRFTHRKLVTYGISRIGVVDMFNRDAVKTLYVLVRGRFFPIRRALRNNFESRNTRWRVLKTHKSIMRGLFY